MVKNLLLKDKGGVSLMIGYVLLIIIAISLSIAVYAFLVLYLPSEEPECSEDIKMVVESVGCAPAGGNKNIEVTLSNRGLFKIQGVFIRAGEKDRIGKKVLNNDRETRDVYDAAGGGGWLPGDPITLPPPGGNHYVLENYDGSLDYEVEIEPFVVNEENGHYVLCSHNLVTKPISCQ